MNNDPWNRPRPPTTEPPVVRRNAPASAAPPKAGNAKTCPNCDAVVSPKAFDCPGCGHPLRKARRGPIGWTLKWLFIAFNLVMAVLLFAGLGSVGETMNTATSEAERAGTAIGATIGTGLVLVFWMAGAVILGLLVLLTRPKK